MSTLGGSGCLNQCTADPSFISLSQRGGQKANLERCLSRSSRPRPDVFCTGSRRQTRSTHCLRLCDGNAHTHTHTHSHLFTPARGLPLSRELSCFVDATGAESGATDCRFGELPSPRAIAMATTTHARPTTHTPPRTRAQCHPLPQRPLRSLKTA